MFLIERRMVLRDIYDTISKRYGSLASSGGDRAWRNSIRHNLRWPLGLWLEFLSLFGKLHSIFLMLDLLRTFLNTFNISTNSNDKCFLDSFQHQRVFYQNRQVAQWSRPFLGHSSSIHRCFFKRRLSQVNKYISSVKLNTCKIFTNLSETELKDRE